MSTTPDAPTVDAKVTDPPAKPEPPKPVEPAKAETDWKAEARKWETRAKENSQAAARLAEIEESNKSESQKLADAKTAAERERDDAKRDVLRLRIATKYGIGDDDIDLFLTGSDEETLSRQAERLAARNAEAGAPRTPRPDPNQGRPTTGAATTADQFAAAISGAFPR